MKDVIVPTQNLMEVAVVQMKSWMKYMVVRINLEIVQLFLEGDGGGEVTALRTPCVWSALTRQEIQQFFHVDIYSFVLNVWRV